MKSFLIACLLLAFSVGFTAYNAYAVQDRVTAVCDLLEQDRAQEVREALAEQDDFLSLSVHHALLEQIGQAAQELCAYAGQDDPNSRAAYESAKATLQILLREILFGEKISLINIF